jgi:hypothetical protein
MRSSLIGNANTLLNEISNKASKRLSIASVKNPRATLEAVAATPMIKGAVSSRGHLSFASVLTNHIIVFGDTVNLSLFIEELRRPLVSSSGYHQILIVSENEPPKWDMIFANYEHIYYLQGSMINSEDFNRTNVREAFSVVLLANRDSVTKVEEENLDADTLFAYLKLEKYIPRNVFFTVELTCASNIAVLNSTMLGQDNTKHSSTSKSSSNLHHNPMSSQTKGTFTSQKKLSYAQAIRKKLNHDGRTGDAAGSVS